MPGLELYRLWGGDEAARFPDDGSMPAHHDYFPSVGGFRFGFFTVPPGSTASPDLAGVDIEEATAAFESAVPGLECAGIVIEDPTLLLYYQNRLVPFAEDIAGEGQEEAARFLSRIGAKR